MKHATQFKIVERRCAACHMFFAQPADQTERDCATCRAGVFNGLYATGRVILVWTPRSKGFVTKRLEMSR